MTDPLEFPPDDTPSGIPDASSIPDFVNDLFPSGPMPEKEPQSRQFITLTYLAAAKGLVPETFLRDQEVLPPEGRDPLYELLDQMAFVHNLREELDRDQADGGTFGQYRVPREMVNPMIDLDFRMFREEVPGIITSIYQYEDTSVREKLLELFRDGLKLEELPEALRREVEVSFQNPDIAAELVRLSRESEEIHKAMKQRIGEVILQLLQDHSGVHDDVRQHAEQLVDYVTLMRTAKEHGYPFSAERERTAFPEMDLLRTRYTPAFIDRLVSLADNFFAHNEQQGPDIQPE